MPLLTATFVLSLNTPLYTIPNPPDPIIKFLSKLFVADFISAKGIFKPRSPCEPGSELLLRELPPNMLKGVHPTLSNVLCFGFLFLHLVPSRKAVTTKKKTTIPPTTEPTNTHKFFLLCTTLVRTSLSISIISAPFNMAFILMELLSSEGPTLT
ncbi:hypothetical protein V8G54_028521 [Vigna mungo]|uniref:Uncharacterized protein n=1 Tax=Vigna mungo TaxID=3915 RepID=A0AAQ3RLR1_VIGMU